MSEDNHPRLFGLLVELDLDFIATSERLWGTHARRPADDSTVGGDRRVRVRFRRLDNMR